MPRFLRKQRAAKLLLKGDPRRILIHSVTPVPAFSEAPDFVRVAFEFIDPPGPWTMQFFEGVATDKELLAGLKPATPAFFFESEDGARTRVLRTQDGRALWPR
jgi:hypothetical protein